MCNVFQDFVPTETPSNLDPAFGTGIPELGAALTENVPPRALEDHGGGVADHATPTTLQLVSKERLSLSFCISLVSNKTFVTVPHVIYYVSCVQRSC